jgi:hypothetical protein
MRIVMVAAVFVLSACAGDRLAPTPPAGVDLSGHWILNEAESDDAQRLMQAQLAAATAGTGPGSTSAGQGGRNGRGGGGLGPGGPAGPQMPAVSMLAEGLRWPGRDLALKQTGDTVTFTADGGSRSCRSGEKHPPPHKGPSHNDPSHGRDAPSRGRGDAPPPRCGWDARTLVVQSSEPDEDRPPFEQRFSVSEDGQRLFEVVSFKGGRSSGFTASRVWDRAP